MKRKFVILAMGLLLSACSKQSIPDTSSSSPSSTTKETMQTSSLEEVTKKDKVTPSQEIVQEEVLIPRDKNQIYGRLFAPVGYQDKRLPMIIFSHGFNNTMEFVASYAEELAHKGYLVYAFDFVGGSTQSRSGGSMLDMSVFTEQADLQTVLNYWSGANYVDANALILMGYSQGGVVSTLVASENPQIKGLVTLNAAFVLFDDARELFEDTASIPDIYNHRGTNLGKVYFEQLLDYDIYQQMSKIQARALIIQGNQDDVVPFPYAERAVESIPDSHLQVVEGAGHIFNRQEIPEVLTSIDDYLHNLLKNR
ncbi:alpha/beta hydrolase [Streptococcus marmotae]|uniref:alpha/beta hydrolase n=1 Tax=Streptococcus marmotae TaxID=1825069 RepID=UPI00082E8A15|nr:alpha/beta fold hydrolase [Streptococcus marmotae]